MGSFTPDPQDVAANKTIAILAWLGILFWLPLVSCPNSAFAKHSANQGLILLIISIVCSILGNIPFLGFLFWIVSLVAFVFMIIGMVKTSQGEVYELPYVGSYTLIK